MFIENFLSNAFKLLIFENIFQYLLHSNRSATLVAIIGCCRFGIRFARTEIITRNTEIKIAFCR